MGNSHSQSASRFTPSLLHSDSRNPKEGKGRKFNVAKFANPENRVLPVASNAPQRLRSTDNGNILQNGGTISGRKANFSPVTKPEPEFVQLLQKKCPQQTSENVSFQTLYGHRKSHSDPDIVRMMMSENDTDEDDSDTDGRCDTEGGSPNRRSIIAVSPSKAKIKSRKKKRAPEPPQSNTLPRTLGRSPSYYKEENKRPDSCHSSYDYNDTPRRPLPPIPPEEMPPPPPPPPPDYNRSDNIGVSKGKNYEKNRRTVEKWKFSKSSQELPVERAPRPRCKSLDRLEEQRLRECTENRGDRCFRNNSLRHSDYVPDGGNAHRSGGDGKAPANDALKDAIADAAKKRAERLERGHEYRNSSFKLSMKHPRDMCLAVKDPGRVEPADNQAHFQYRNVTAYSHKSQTDQHISRHDRHGKAHEKSSSEHSSSHNFSRKTPTHKKPENKKDYRNECPIGPYERQQTVDCKHYNGGPIAITPNEISDRQSKWDSIIHDPMTRILPESTVSISSASEEEMEIDLQLRPTLPRRPIEISRFSPTDVWKSINLDFFKSHQQRSDVSSDDADDIMEEKICRINRPVAPRRLIHDRSGDSGISPDAGSPMLLNESLDVLMMNNNAMGNNTTPAPLITEVDNSLWVPQHDLADDSECGSDDSPSDHRNNVSKVNVQAKFSMPNLMFPSRSLPRTDNINGLEDDGYPDKEKVRSKGRRKKSYKNAEGQHFNSLRNLKKALGLRSKVLVEESNGLDPNWSLSRSLPNFINNLNVENTVRAENESPELYILDHIRRSNSESKAVPQEKTGCKLVNSRSIQNVNLEWRKSFPGQSSDGHVIYLPEYRTSVSPMKIHSTTDDLNVNTDSEVVMKRPNCRKKFSYQSTVRQEEKKKLEEKLAREVESRERKRQEEIEWMNKVEEEFRKQRDKEKVNIRHQLRILNLQEKSDSNKESYQPVPKQDLAEFADNLSKIKPNVQYAYPEHNEGKISPFTNGQELNEDSNKWQQPTGMKKWLKRQNRDYQPLSPMRPEPEGGRSSSDDSKNIDGKKGNTTEKLQTRTYYRNVRGKCIHGNDVNCSACNESYRMRSYELSRKESNKMIRPDKTTSMYTSSSVGTKKVDGQMSSRKQMLSKPHHPDGNETKENGHLTDGSRMRDSIEEYELHTRLCRTNSGRTFESHSYYTLERRKEDAPEMNGISKGNPGRESSTNFFSTPNFQKELKENVRKKARDFEKRTRKYQSCDYDTDDSGSDVREARYQRPHVARSQKKKPTGEPSFSRNHPHRNGGRVKSQGHGHMNGRSPTTFPKNSANRAILPQQRILSC